jgi:hypothetical protein
MEYGLQLLEVPEVVRLSDREPILLGEYAENGMPFVNLTELLHLPDLTKETGAQDDQHVRPLRSTLKSWDNLLWG